MSKISVGDALLQAAGGLSDFAPVTWEWVWWRRDLKRARLANRRALFSMFDSKTAALLARTEFESVDQLRQLSELELQDVPGIGFRTARKIADEFARRGIPLPSPPRARALKDRSNRAVARSCAREVSKAITAGDIARSRAAAEHLLRFLSSIDRGPK